MVFREVRDSLICLLTMPLSLRHLLRHGPRIAAAFAEERRRRPRQLQRLQSVIGP